MSEEATLDEFVNDDSDSDTSKQDLLTSLDETSVGNIPSEWSAVRLSELTKDTLYGANESAEDYDPDKPRYIRIKDIDDQGRLKESEKASLSTDKAEGYLLKKGDMLFARSGSPGRTYLHRYDEGKYCYGGYSIKHELVSEGLNHEYLSQYTKSQKYWDWIERIARTGAQANINSGEYASLLVPLPSLPEQRKIATVLYTVDRAIEVEAKISEQVERVERGLQQALFSGEQLDCERKEAPTMGEVPVDWDIKMMGDVCDITMGSSPKSEHYNESGDGLPFFQANNEFGLRNPEHDRWCSNPVKTADKGDSLMTLRGTYVGQMNIADRECCIGRGLAGISAGKELLEEYLYQHLRRRERYVKSIAIGSTFDSVSSSDLENLPILIPPKQEQEKIAKTLKSVQERLRFSEKHIEQLQRFKRGLMQDLLSGTVRTTDTNIEVPEEIAQYG
jgi:type I restriction enzyme S subunit